MPSSTRPTVPIDFPRERRIGAVAGMQPKLAVVMVGRQFVEDPQEDEVFCRYDACRDLVDQLKAYCQRKLRNKPVLDLAQFRSNLRQGVVNKAWGFSAAELGWIMLRLSEQMGWAAVGAGENDQVSKSESDPVQRGLTVFQVPESVVRRLLAIDQVQMRHVETVVDKARAGLRALGEQAQKTDDDPCH